MNVPDLIDRLGGTMEVSRLCDIRGPSVSGWKQRNTIPKAQLNYLKAVRPQVFEAMEKDEAKAKRKAKRAAK